MSFLFVTNLARSHCKANERLFGAVPLLYLPFGTRFIMFTVRHIHRIRTLLLWLSQAADRSPETAWRGHSSYSRCTYKAPRLLSLLEMFQALSDPLSSLSGCSHIQPVRLVSHVADYLPLPAFSPPAALSLQNG